MTLLKLKLRDLFFECLSTCVHLVLFFQYFESPGHTFYYDFVVRVFSSKSSRNSHSTPSIPLVKHSNLRLESGISNDRQGLRNYGLYLIWTLHISESCNVPVRVSCGPGSRETVPLWCQVEILLNILRYSRFGRSYSNRSADR